MKQIKVSEGVEQQTHIPSFWQRLGSCTLGLRSHGLWFPLLQQEEMLGSELARFLSSISTKSITSIM